MMTGKKLSKPTKTKTDEQQYNSEETTTNCTYQETSWKNTRRRTVAQHAPISSGKTPRQTILVRTATAHAENELWLRCSMAQDFNNWCRNTKTTFAQYITTTTQPLHSIEKIRDWKNNGDMWEQQFTSSNKKWRTTSTIYQTNWAKQCYMMVVAMDVAKCHGPPRIVNLASGMGLRAGWRLDLITKDTGANAWGFNVPKKKTKIARNVLTITFFVINRKSNVHNLRRHGPRQPFPNATGNNSSEIRPRTQTFWVRGKIL